MGFASEDSTNYRLKILGKEIATVPNTYRCFLPYTDVFPYYYSLYSTV
jgi:hypothetical protein